MPNRITPEERIEAYFQDAPESECLTQLDRIALMVRTRFKVPLKPVTERAPRRGRPRKKRDMPLVDSADLKEAAQAMARDRRGGADDD